jgi:hypothetical protein
VPFPSPGTKGRARTYKGGKLVACKENKTKETVALLLYLGRISS